jgi:ArsR family transcriptional regulator
MDVEDAITRMSALATRSRLDVLSLLAKDGGDRGMQSGEIARRLGVPANTLSTQLLHLSNARLVRFRRESRSVIYSANLDSIRELIEFLAGDCAGGRIAVSVKVPRA